MKRNFLLSLTFLLVLAVPGLKSEIEPVETTEIVAEQVTDEKMAEEAVAQTFCGLSEAALETMGDIDPETITQVEIDEPEFKETWKIKWLGVQAQLDSYMFNAKEYVNKHKLRCGLGAAGTTAAIVVMACLIYKLKKNKPGPGQAIN